ncbi:MAG: cytochrome c biogenesis protein CcsA [Candidatus Zixiibacteriota bacterium]
MARFGDFFIYAAFAFSILTAIAYFLTWRGKEQYQGLARSFYRLTAGFVVAAIVTLLMLIIRHDYSVAYVYSYSSNDLPWFFLMASLWGGQEGTFLLWLTYTSVLGYIMMKTAKQFERGNMFFLSLFMISLLMILIKKSPFELSPVLRDDGAGLNPLLQNYWMTIHPPIMFLGFAGAVFPFTFALTALVERKYHVWAEAARRWTMFAWCALGVSLVMGGYWAYETLGWGGFWAWDPVENSSLIPWLFLTTQVHSLFIKRQRRGMMRFSLFAVCLTFWSVLYGTFLTRSGVLADFSVHSFVDLGINAFLIGGLFFFIGLGSFWLIYRWKDINPEKSFSKINSRSYLVTLGILILFLGGWLVMLGTSAPLITRLAEKASNVGQPYYFSTMTPIAVAILLLTALFPVYRWNEGVAKKKLLIIGSSVGALTIATLAITGFTHQVIYLALFGTAAWSFVVNSYVFINSLRNGNLLPGYLSHVGLAMAITGAAVANGFETKEQVTLIQNQPVAVMGHTLDFVDIKDSPKGFDCHINVTDDDGSSYVALLPHEFPKNAEGVMKKPHVKNHLAYDLYLAPVSIDRPTSDDPGSIFLKKGESQTMDKYTLTFNRFNVPNHGSDSAMSASALITVAYDGKSEDISPTLSVSGREVTPTPATFDNGRATALIAGLRPEDGGVVLKLMGDFVAAGQASPATIIVEVSKKPLILMFWLGAIIAFLGGGLSMYERRRRTLTEADGFEKETGSPRSLSAVSSDAA